MFESDIGTISSTMSDKDEEDSEDLADALAKSTMPDNAGDVTSATDFPGTGDSELDYGCQGVLTPLGIAYDDDSVQDSDHHHYEY